MGAKFGLAIVIVCLSVVFDGRIYGNPIDGGQAGAVVTYLEGEIILQADEGSRVPELGDELTPGNLLTTGEDGKVKIFFRDRGLLTIVPSGSRIRIGTNGVDIIWGVKDKIITKTIPAMIPNPDLDKRSRQLGGAFIMRSLGGIQILNLNDTFIRETRPEFCWKFNKNVSFRISLFLLSENNTSSFVWSRETKDSILAYPDSEAELEPGKSYQWEVAAFNGNERILDASARFYVLGREENISLKTGLDTLEKFTGEANFDDITFFVLKVNLYAKYNLDDDIKALINELRVKYPDKKRLGNLLNLLE